MLIVIVNYCSFVFSKPKDFFYFLHVHWCLSLVADGWALTLYFLCFYDGCERLMHLGCFSFLYYINHFFFEYKY